MARCLWILTQQWRLLDLPLVMHLQLVQLARSAASLSAKSERTTLLETKWLPWAYPAVRRGLLCGTLSKTALIEHMQAAPTEFMKKKGVAARDGTEWCASAGLQGDPSAVALRTPVGRLAHLAMLFGFDKSIIGSQGGAAVLSSLRYRRAIAKAGLDICGTGP
jgi:hypothetical protein